MEWQPIETAPRDGSAFLARNADHLSFGVWLMMRHVRHSRDPAIGRSVMKDMGAWILVREGGLSSPNVVTEGLPHIPFSVAADECNRSVVYEWRPLYEPRVEIARISEIEKGEA